jgi:hypothetical protein
MKILTYATAALVVAGFTASPAAGITDPENLLQRARARAESLSSKKVFDVATPALYEEAQGVTKLYLDAAKQYRLNADTARALSTVKECVGRLSDLGGGEGCENYGREILSATSPVELAAFDADLKPLGQIRVAQARAATLMSGSMVASNNRSGQQSEYIEGSRAFEQALKPDLALGVLSWCIGSPAESPPEKCESEGFNLLKRTAGSKEKVEGWRRLINSRREEMKFAPVVSEYQARIADRDEREAREERAAREAAAAERTSRARAEIVEAIQGVAGALVDQNQTQRSRQAASKPAQSSISGGTGSATAPPRQVTITNYEPSISVGASAGSGDGALEQCSPVGNSLASIRSNVACRCRNLQTAGATLKVTKDGAACVTATNYIFGCARTVSGKVQCTQL